MLSLVALIGFGLRYRNRGDDLSRWLGSAATLSLFSALYRVFAPLTPPTSVSVGDFLRVIAFGVLLVGVWRAISAAEFGRAVADERARVARDIHDGLAQYLFALATHASMLEAGKVTDEAITASRSSPSRRSRKRASRCWRCPRPAGLRRSTPRFDATWSF